MVVNAMLAFCKIIYGLFFLYCFLPLHTKNSLVFLEVRESITTFL